MSNSQRACDPPSLPLLPLTRAMHLLQINRENQPSAWLRYSLTDSRETVRQDGDQTKPFNQAKVDLGSKKE
ncbi:hypothetical protein E2C01_016174 [Portunus trituberculatus]|uniref:Uncharacterized protein n=1 Tax=Portunus trituberculatus TaxID=210409 RepID=A0A5B7DPK4_PORTR|nr:hypothetical protein [Portunus trituberculatus]